MSEANQTRKVVLFDTEEVYRNLLPLSYTRPVGAFRVGIDTIAEKWRYFLPGEYSWLTRPYLSEKFPVAVRPEEEAVFVAGNVLPDAAIAARTASLSSGKGLYDSGGLWAWRGTLREFLQLASHAEEYTGDYTLYNKEGVLHPDIDAEEYDVEERRIRYVFDVFIKNPGAILEDYSRICAGRRSQAPDETTRVIGPMYQSGGTPSLMIEEGASVIGAIINVNDGPVYIGRDAQVMEGCCLRGPLAVCEGTRIRMGSRIYGGTTFGPSCRIGGEVDNTVVFGYSNKAHDGYLGNAVIGEWCNIGAGANASNLKNDYSKIRIWNYAQRRFMRTDLQFCGLIMGDHSKAAINTMFNTATVVGVGVNFHGAGFPRTFIPSFSNGSPEAGFDDMSVNVFFRIASTVMGRRGLELTDVDRRIFEKIHEMASDFKKS